MLERLDTVICNNSGEQRNPRSPYLEDKITKKLKRKLKRKPTIGFLGKSHSKKAKQKMRKAKLRDNPGAFKEREKNLNWNGGIYVDERGYVFVLSPNHPHPNNIGYVKRSRLVMEKHLGRYLEPEEVVHHENEIKHDDRVENLNLFANGGEHTSFHNLQRRKE